MLTPEELQRAIQSLVDDWKQGYPTPWPLLHWLHGLHVNQGGGVDLDGKFLVALLPSPEWWDWFVNTAMHAAFVGWGEAKCREELHRIRYEWEGPDSENPTEVTIRNQWRWDRDKNSMELIAKYWFPQELPQTPGAYFPSEGYKKQDEAPPKQVFR